MQWEKYSELFHTVMVNVRFVQSVVIPVSQPPQNSIIRLGIH